MSIQPKPITDTKIPGTDVPDISKAEVENAAQRRWMSRVAVTTAVLAALASIGSMFSTNNLNEAMLEQIRASDQWSFYQAKGIKLAVLEGRLETLPALGKPVADADTAKAERYQHEQQDISTEAKAHQSSAELHRARYTSFSRAATAFQIGIALAAVALLVRKNWFWMASLIVALGGCTFFVLGLLPH